MRTTHFRVPLTRIAVVQLCKPHLLHSSTVRPWLRTYTNMAEAPVPKRLNNPVIFVCDLQEKFRNAIYEFDKVVLTTKKVLRASQVLSIPILVTTQNRARLGDTVSELSPYLSGPLCKAQVDKTIFSMWISSLTAHLPTSTTNSSSLPDIVLVGIESHICITQTALDAKRAGHKVYVLADGVSSCNREEVPIALARLRAEGVIVTTSESWLYEVVGDASLPVFKEIIKIVKDTAQDTKLVLNALTPLPLTAASPAKI